MVSYVVYNFVIFFSFLTAYFAEKSNKKEVSIFFRFLCFLILFIPASIRYNIGTDYIEYLNETSFDDYEPSFRILNHFVNILNTGSQTFFVLTSFFIYAPLCFFLTKKNFGLKILLYGLLLYLYSYNVIRNAIAISFLIIALDWFIAKKNTYFICFFLLLSVTFHYSILFIIPVFIVDRVKINLKLLLLLMAIAFLSVLNNSFFLFMNSPLFLESKYSIYIGSVHSGQTEIGSGLGIVLILLPPFFCLFFFKKMYYHTSYKILNFLIFFYIISYILALKIMIFGRLSDIFSVSVILAIPICFSLIKYRYKFYIQFILIILIFVLFEKQIISNKRNNASGGHGIYPYGTIFN